MNRLSMFLPSKIQKAIFNPASFNSPGLVDFTRNYLVRIQNMHVNEGKESWPREKGVS